MMARRVGLVMMAWAVMALFTLALMGCGGGGSSANAKVTKGNYDKIKDDMTEKEVVDILGVHSEVVNEVDLKEAGKMKMAVWKNGNNQITLTFKNGKVSGNKSSQFVN